MALQVLIVEDHPLFASALESAIQGLMPDVEIAHAGLIREAKSALHVGRFDLVLLDLCLPDTSGFNGLIELRQLCPKTPILISSAFDDPSVIHSAMTFGASGFVPKSASKTDLVFSIQNVLAGNISLPRSYAMPDRVSEDLTHGITCLTPKQLLVLQMLCQGLLNKQIAHQLNIGETTVKAHVSEILRKLSVTTRTQAVLQASNLNLEAGLTLGPGGNSSDDMAL